MEIFKFIKWQWMQFEFWQKTFLWSMILMLLSIFLSNPYDLFAWLIAMTILGFWLFKWTLVDGIKNSYRKYKKEKQELFQNIKESDK